MLRPELDMTPGNPVVFAFPFPKFLPVGVDIVNHKLWVLDPPIDDEEHRMASAGHLGGHVGHGGGRNGLAFAHDCLRSLAAFHFFSASLYLSSEYSSVQSKV